LSNIKYIVWFVSLLKATKIWPKIVDLKTLMIQNINYKDDKEDNLCK